MRTLSYAVIAAALAIPSPLYAQNNPAGGVGGAVGGAAVGGMVGGPVGALVGAGVGSIMGSQLPSQPSVTYNGPVAVGEPLPRGVVTYAVPRHRHFRYAVINNERVIVDRRTGRIERVIP